MILRRIAFVAVAVYFSLLVPGPFLGVLHAAGDTCDYEKMFGREDKTIFGRDCALCHSIGGPWQKPGGALGGLFAKKQLLTGEPVTEESVRKRIADGGPGMPAFKYTLTAVQINDLVQYLKTVNCPEDPAMKKLIEEKERAQTSPAP